MRTIIRNPRVRNRVLWTLQTLLSLVFLFAGTAKLRMPADVLTQQTGLPGGFMHFIAICEVLGALGLVLPGLFRIHTELTPIAAVALLPIMTGAVVLSLIRLGAAAAAMPLVVGLLVFSVARARWPRRTLPSPRPDSDHEYREAA